MSERVKSENMLRSPSPLHHVPQRPVPQRPSQLRALLLLSCAALCACSTVGSKPVATRQNKPNDTNEPRLERLTPLREIALSPMEWKTAYTGHGIVYFPAGDFQPLWLSSGIPMSSGVTHAALLLSAAELPSYGYAVEVEYALLRQHRRGAPNPWETFWVFFGYRPGPRGEKTTNYVLVKPNGLEAGKAWGGIEQAFVHTMEAPRLPVGSWAKLRIEVGESKVRIRFNDATVATLDRHEFYSQRGHIGLYVEDSQAAVRAVRFGPLDSEPLR